MKKKWFVLLMLTFVALIAWTNGDGDSEKVETGPRYSENVDPFGKYDPPIELTYAKETNAATDFPSGWSYENNIWNDTLAEEYGINMVLKFSAIGGDKYNTKMNLAIASNDLPDVMTLTSNTQFSRLINAGKLESLTEEYEKFLYPVAKQYFEEDGGVMKSWGMVGDDLYGMARSTVSYQSPRLVHIRKDWREELGLAKPKTMNDVLEIARAFKAVDPENRWGVLINNEIVDNGFCDIVGMANSMNVYPRRWIDDGTGNLIYGSVQPGMKDVLKLYNNMWNEGLLDPEFGTKNGGVTAPTLTNSKVGVILGAFWIESWPLPSLYESEGADWELYPILPMEGYDQNVKVQVDNTPRQMYAVRKGYSNPEALFKILNLQVAKLNDPELAEPDTFHSDGTYSFHSYMPFYPAYAPLRINLDSNPNVTNAIDKNDKSYLVSPHDKKQYESVKRYVDALAAGEKPAGGDWVAAKFFYGPNSSFGILNEYWNNDQFFVSPASGIETDEMARKQQTLNQLESKYIIDIIMGEKPVSAFDEWVDEWGALGGELIQYEINEWYKSVRE